MADEEGEDYWNSSVSHSKVFSFDDANEGEGGHISRMFTATGAPAPREVEPESSNYSLDLTTSEVDRLSITSGGSLRNYAEDEPKSITLQPAKESSFLSITRKSNQTKPESPPKSKFSPTSSIISSSKSTKVVLAKPGNQQSASNDTLTLTRKSSSSSTHSHVNSELSHIRKSLDFVTGKDQWIKISPKDMVWRIVQNKTYNLEHYRSLDEKIALLDYSLNLHDTNAILVAILHLKNTVSETLFFEEMSRKPDAVDQYVTYLEEDGRSEECLNLLQNVDRTEEATILQLKLAVESPTMEQRLKQLDATIRRLPALSPAHQKFSELTNVKRYRSLMEIQRPIEEHDERLAREGKTELFIQFPRKSLLGMSLIQTLFYCCMYHFDKPETNFCSPHFLRKTFAMGEKQYLWTALDALSKTQKWTEIQSLLTDRTGWFGAPKPKALIGFEKVVDILIRNSSPPDVLAYYLRLIDEPETRLHCARKCKCHSVIIDTLAALKDFSKLEEYSSRLDTGTNEYKYCQEVLHRHR
ncbi:hypothetical protein RvY_08567 [Ramazzottius varieornatus]|uniref:Vps16 C-terminal domain-containing protein n=1 Tax=Ramazzottius varieornatus TaxID=947166 RepID=A0A1D1V697_RAMVA|nr:hypothetical protein RvY_08567 [Ramazzottius varieornatus]